jgi:hypothetical protein
MPGSIELMTNTPPDRDLVRDSMRQRYLANLHALYLRDPELAARVDALPFGDLPAFEPARDGGWTARLTADDGREVYLHSRYHPVEEAEKFVANLPSVENPSFFLGGLGLGYHLPALARRYDGPLLIVAEEDVRLIKATLYLHELHGWIGDGRLIFLTAPENRLFNAKLCGCNANVLMGVQLAALPHTSRCRAEFHERMRRAFADYILISRTQMVTLLKTAQVTFKNIALNLPHYLENRGVEALRNRAAGYPAIVVAAGPSLARNVRLLAELRNRAVIVGVQTVLRLLNALGIRPHFVTSLDYHEVSGEFFRGIEDFGDTVLVAEPKATWHVLDLFTAGKHVLRHRFHETLLRDAAPARGEMRAGTTVAHLAFYVAQHLGCDPILFVGQDLAYSEGMFYIPGSPLEKTWEPELNRFETIEMKQWERIVRNRPILRKTKDIHGRDAYNDEVLYNYRQQFENDFAVAPQRIIQASEGGVPFAHAEIMPLREAAERFCTRPLPANLTAPTADPRAAEWKTRSAVELEKRIEELERVHATAREMIELLEKLETLVEKPLEFNRQIVRVDALRILIHEYDAVYRLVLDVSAAAELRRFAADRDIGKPETETPAIARRRLKRDREFVASFLKGCEFLADVLPLALRRIREPL